MILPFYVTIVRTFSYSITLNLTVNLHLHPYPPDFPAISPVFISLPVFAGLIVPGPYWSSFPPKEYVYLSCVLTSFLNITTLFVYSLHTFQLLPPPPHPLPAYTRVRVLFRLSLFSFSPSFSFLLSTLLPFPSFFFHFPLSFPRFPLPFPST